MTIRNEPRQNTSPIQRTRRLGTAVEAVRRGTAKLFMKADQLELSTAGKLAEGNKMAVNQAANTLVKTVTHPFEAFKGIGETLFNMVFHPIEAFQEAGEIFDKDPIDGTVMGANITASWLGLSALMLAAGATLAAPFTAGASLALLPTAASLGGVAGTIGTVALGTSFFKNQLDIASATTKEELVRESNQLGDDLANYGFSLILEKGADRLKGQPIPDEAINPSLIDLPEGPAPKLQKPSMFNLDPIPDALSVNYELVHGEENREG